MARMVSKLDAWAGIAHPRQLQVATGAGRRLTVERALDSAPGEREKFHRKLCSIGRIPGKLIQDMVKPRRRTKVISRSRRLAILAALIASLSIPARAGAQVGSIRFEPLSLEQGLSQSAVFTILQDRWGFMWFGTEGGLNKYDGYQFTVYRHNPEDLRSLSDDYVSAIYEDRDGNLWIGTKQGLNRFDRENGTFVHYQHDPNDPDSLGGTWVVSILEDRDGKLWIGTDDAGLDQFDRVTEAFSHFPHDPEDSNALSSDSVTTLYEDRSGTLWVGTDAGLDRLDTRTGSFRHYRHDPTDLQQSLSDDEVRAVFEDREGRLWVGTESGGLNQLNLASQTFVHYRHNPADPNSLSHDRVRAVLEDSAGRLWIGTQNGLNVLNPRSGRFIHYMSDPYDPHSLSSNAVWSMYEDRAGVLWFGTYGGGVNKYSPTSNRFTTYRHRPTENSLSDDMVWAISEDRSGLLWIGTFNGGLNRLDRTTETFLVYQNDTLNPASLSSNDVRAILEDHSGVLWVGTSGGLDRLNRETNSFVHYRHNPNDPASLSDNRVTALLEDRTGNLWVGTRRGGLNRLDRDSGSFTRYQHNPDDPSSLSDDRVWSIYEDRDGTLWVGTLGGLNLWHGAEKGFERFLHDPDDPQSLSNDAIWSFYEDPEGVMWIGTWGGGLNRFDPARRAFSAYTEADGLPDNVIYGILADTEGGLWLSTNKGVSKFDPKTETPQNYDINDGLQDNEFNAGAHFVSSRGEMFFGGIHGFNAFYPEQITTSTHIPPIVITAFLKFNETVRTDLPPDDHIQLAYNDNFVSFDFTALDHTAPERNQYAYRMEGLDPDWVEAGTRRHADYPNLRPGDYVFRVRGSNGDGVWNEAGVAVYLTVRPPFWDTWWFQGLIATALMGAVIGGYRYRVKSVEARSRELENQVRQRTYELNALYRADEELHRHLELDQVLQALVDVAVDILETDKSAVFLRDEAQSGYAIKIARGVSPETIAQLSIPRGGGVIDDVIRRDEPVLVSDTHTNPRHPSERAEVLAALDAEGIRSFMHLPLKVNGQVFGVFSVAFTEPHVFSDEEQRLYLALAQRAALAIENAQLYKRSQEAATLEERSRLARELHDAVTQTLFSASLIADVLPDLWERDPEEGKRHLKELRQLSRGALAEMRALLLELRPKALLEANLRDLLRQLGEAAAGRTGVPVSVTVEGSCLPPSDVQVGLYRIAQEALNNVVKHADANQVNVCLRYERLPGTVDEGCSSLTLVVSDDGHGFDPKEIPPDHLGLGIMRERARAIGGELTVESQPGHGTHVRVSWKG